MNTRYLDLADVMSMSYTWINVELGNYRGIYRAAHEHLCAAGVVAVGGAGNFSENPAGKQIVLPEGHSVRDRCRRNHPRGNEGTCQQRGAMHLVRGQVLRRLSTG